MKITLVNPNYPMPENLVSIGMPAIPLGLAYIAAVTEEAGHEVTVIDGFGENLTLEQTIKKLRTTKPDVTGISCVTCNVDLGREIAKVARSFSKQIVFGGLQPSLDPMSVLDVCDVVVKGEGEETFPELLSGKDWHEIKGLVFLKDGNPFYTKERPLIIDLDSLPLPARHLFPLDSKRYKMFGVVPFGTILSSRGCSMGCAFCANTVVYSEWRGRSPNNVVDELEILVKQYGDKMVAFADEDVLVEPKRVDEICDEILKRNLKFYWGIDTRVDRITDLKLLKKLSKAGCGFVFLGVESVSAQTLRDMKKGITAEITQRAFKLCKKANIRAVASAILGFPGETKADAEATIKFVKKIGAEVAFFGVPTPFPGTPFYDLCEKNGWIKERNLSKYVVVKYPIIETEEISLKDSEKILNNAYRSFYFRPLYLIKRLVHELTRLDKDTLKSFVKWSIESFWRSMKW